MKLLKVSTSISPDSAEFVRMTGLVERGTGDQFEIWFEVSCALEGDLSSSGNPWLIAMLPYAMETGETISGELATDAFLVENVKGVIAVWCEWYPQLKAPSIQVPLAPFDTGRVQGGRVAAFFSGGIDSWFTVLRHMPELEKAAVGRLDDLVTVHGFDIPIESPREFERLRLPLATKAQELGRQMIVIKTNLRRNNSLWAKGWGWLTHAAGLSTCALILEPRFGSVLIGSSYPFGGLGPWGSHPMTDQLFSTSYLAVKHDGASFDRVEKTMLVAHHNVALSDLHVCWQQQSGSNCGHCSKCIRTMATLQLFGALRSTGPFPVEFRATDLASLYVADEHEESFINEIHVHALRLGNEVIGTAAGQALRRSKRMRPLIKLVDSLIQVPFLWRFAPNLRRWCLRELFV
jgi:hypothetical protein